MKKKWYGKIVYKPGGIWDQQADQLVVLFGQCGHPEFRGMSAFSRGTLMRKSGRNTLHFTADLENIELLMRTIDSANQLSIHGAVSSWCTDFSESMQGHEFFWSEYVQEQLSQQLDPQEVGSFARNSSRTQGAAGNCWRELKKKGSK